MQRKSKGIWKEEWGACRQTGTFQTWLHKSWQLISNSQSTCPDILSRGTYFSTRALPTPPHLHLSRPNPDDLFDVYLFIAIAAAACALAKLKTPVISHKKTKGQRYGCNDQWRRLVWIGCMSHCVQISDMKNGCFWPLICLKGTHVYFYNPIF